MNQLGAHDWKIFQKSVCELTENSSKKEVWDVIVNWLSKNTYVLEIEPFKNYRLEGYLKICFEDVSYYPSSIPYKAIKVFKERIASYRIKDTKCIAQFIHGVLDDLSVVKVDHECTSCGESEAKIFKEKLSNEIVYVCSFCGSAVDTFGREFTNYQSLVFPEKKDLVGSLNPLKGAEPFN